MFFFLLVKHVIAKNFDFLKLQIDKYMHYIFVFLYLFFKGLSCLYLCVLAS